MYTTRFLDKTCNIKSVSITNVNGSQKKGFTTIYSGILCDFRAANSNNLDDSDISRDTDLKKYEVVLESDKTSVRVGMYIELIDSLLGTQGEYIIETVESYKNLAGVNDNVFLRVRQR